MSARVSLAALLALLVTACAAGDVPRGPLLAQRGGTRCHVDTDCHVALPRPRACPHGGQSTPTACCRAEYCGVCWSDCPAAGTKTHEGEASSSLVL